MLTHIPVDDPPISLLTLCSKCCAELKLLDQSDQLRQILNRQGDHNTTGMVLGVSYGEIEEVFLSKVFTLQGCFTTPFTTAGVDGQWKEWNKF
jgi:hypothetical protein